MIARRPPYRGPGSLGGPSTHAARPLLEVGTGPCAGPTLPVGSLARAAAVPTAPTVPDLCTDLVAEHHALDAVLAATQERVRSEESGACNPLWESQTHPSRAITDAASAVAVELLP